jgi:hypothetical protein
MVDGEEKEAVFPFLFFLSCAYSVLLCHHIVEKIRLHISTHVVDAGQSRSDIFISRLARDAKLACSIYPWCFMSKGVNTSNIGGQV